MPDNLDEPSHRLMRDVAAEAPFRDRLAGAAGARTTLGRVQDYDTWLSRAGCSVDLWRTTYIHPLPSIAASSSGAIDRPAAVPGAPRPDEQAAYLARYEAALRDAYPAQEDGRCCCRSFPRLFLVARRR